MALDNLERLVSEDRAAVGFAQAGVEAELEDRPGALLDGRGSRMMRF